MKETVLDSTSYLSEVDFMCHKVQINNA